VFRTAIFHPFALKALADPGIRVRKAQNQKGTYQKGPIPERPIPERPIPERPNII